MDKQLINKQYARAENLLPSYIVPLLLFMLFSFSYTAHSQDSISPYCNTSINIVPNPSFEDCFNDPDCLQKFYNMTFPPNGLNFKMFEKTWFNASSPISSIYININSDSCKTEHCKRFLTYNNLFGRQEPKEGNSYAFFFSYYQYEDVYTPRIYVYPEVRLKEPMKEGRKYFVRFYVSLTDYSVYASNNIGVYFSKDSLKKDYHIQHIPYSNDSIQPFWGGFFDIEPQLEFKQIITDTANWVELSGYINAKGGEEFMTIGVFKDTLQEGKTKYIIANPNGQSMTTAVITRAYYYLDDISVFECGGIEVEASNDTTICKGATTQLGKYNFSNYQYSWAPTTALSNPLSPTPTAKPNSPTMYYLYQTDFQGVITIDSVYVNVINCDTAISPYCNTSINLVPNPSFEDCFNDPDCLQKFYNIADYSGYNFSLLEKTWFYANGIPSSIFININSDSCKTEYCKHYITYNNIDGKQIPKEGNSYAFFFSYYQYEDIYAPRAYIYPEVRLKEPMKEGRKYFVRFYVSLTDYSVYASNNIAVYFSKDSLKKEYHIQHIPYSNDSIFPFGGGFFDIEPQLEFKQIITDTANWVELSGYINANGGEEFMTIGVFKDTLQEGKTKYITANPNGQSMTTAVVTRANYYLDDISVFECGGIEAEAGNDTTICKGATTQLGKYNFSNYQYSWAPTTALSNPLSPTPTAKPNSPTMYYLYQTDFQGVITIDSVYVNVDSCGHRPPANAGNDQDKCPDQNIYIGTQSIDGYKYLWTPNLYIDNDTIAMPTCFASTNIKYILQTTDFANIKTTDSVYIYIINCDTLIDSTNTSIQIPNIISPNNDGINDILTIKGIEQAFSIIIFNRWGKEIYSSDNYKNDWNAHNIAPGTYYYIIKTSDNQKTFKGFFTIIK